MSLKWYVRPRIVALKSDASVLDAARAIEHNNIGAVVVQDKGSVVGIVTDRDLAIRALGPRAGLPVAGLAGGFVSSTATIGAMGARARASSVRSALHTMRTCARTVTWPNWRGWCAREAG